MRILNTGAFVILANVVIVMATPGAAYGQCDADYWGGGPDGCAPDGVMSFTDINDLSNCVVNGFERCGRDPLAVCDVDQNGVVDYCDIGYAIGLFLGVPAPDACDEPCWACCSEGDDPGCVETTEGACPGVYAGGVYQGDGVSCVDFPCTCYADYWGPGGVPDGVVDFSDISAVTECVLYGAEPHGRDPALVCDVDNNGVIDFCDVSYAVNLFRNIPAPAACEEPCWACCAAEDLPSCIMATEWVCTNSFGGYYQGDGISCIDDPCTCHADYWGGGLDLCTPDGKVDYTDISALSECVLYGADPCGRDPAVVCDVDDNGAVDFCDIDYAVNLFRAIPTPAACQQPCGACCRAPEEPACIVATESRCPDYDGVFRGDGMSCVDDDENGIADACEQPCPIASRPQPEPSVPDVGFGTRVRYLSFVAGDPGRLEAIRVTFSSIPLFPYASGCQLWVGEPRQVSEISGASGSTPPPTFWAAELQAEPYYTDWTQYESVHVYGQDIVPSATYWLQAVDSDCLPLDEGDYSSVLEVGMSRWGDVVSHCGLSVYGSPDGEASLGDVAALVDKFRNLPGAVSKSQADIDGPYNGVPNQKVDFTDIPRAVEAFRGLPYPYPGPLCAGGAVCGNGVPEPGEQCDDGDADNTNACLDTCRDASCGDGFVWSGIEQCDDGNAIPNDGCDANCQIEAQYCGDGAVNGTDQCDDAGESQDCDADCTYVVCGDGTLNETAGEECDDWNTDPGDGCDATCQIEGTATVSLVPVRSTGVHALRGGNEILLPAGGQVVELEIHLSEWGPALLKTWQATIDSSGYTTGLAGTLTPHTIACAADADCLSGYSAEFGQPMGVCVYADDSVPCIEDADCPPSAQCRGAMCSFPSYGDDQCTPGYMLAGREDGVLLTEPAIVDFSELDYRYGATGVTAFRADLGTPGYGGTLLLEVPPGAAGTFTIGLDEERTYMCDSNGDPIPIKYLEPALITIHPCLAPAAPGMPPWPYNLADAGNGIRVRYLSFAGGTPGAPEAIRVTLATLPAPYGWDGLEGESWWVGPPQEFCEKAGQGSDVLPANCEALPPGEVLPRTFWGATLQCNPYFTDWSLYSSVHVYAQRLVPSWEDRLGGQHSWTTYDVELVEQGSEDVGFCFSDPLSITMSVWGDTVDNLSYALPPEGVVDMVDVSSIVDRFRNIPGAPSKSRADVATETPDRLIDFNDIPALVDAFKGLPYPYAAPVTCP